MEAMAEFYGSVKRALSDPGVPHSNPWVTASKLCARKRPGLFPVRDTNVCELLGLTGRGRPRGNYEIDWLVFQELITTDTIMKAVGAVQMSIKSLGDEYKVDQHRLRVLDAALWTYTVW